MAYNGIESILLVPHVSISYSFHFRNANARISVISVVSNLNWM